MTMMLPVVFNWLEVDRVDGEGEVHRVKAMVPQPRYGKIADLQFHDGEEYPLVVLEARSRESHNHYFAAVAEGWHNLPEEISARFPSAEHLRKWALIECGWFDEHEVDCGTKRAAREAAMLCRRLDVFARIHIHESMVLVRRATSQSAKAMGKGEFENSKRAVLDLISSMIGVPSSALKKHAGRSA